MPGLFGTIISDGFSQQSVDITNLFTTNCSYHETWRFGKHHGGIISVSDQPHSYFSHDIFVAYEGFFLDHDGDDKDIFQNIYARYLREGHEFVKHLRGSFQILIIDGRNGHDSVFLYADHTASRQIFYTQTASGLLFAPDVPALTPLLREKTLDEMACVQFMVSGHFPAGCTAIEQVKMLGPGEMLTVAGGGVSKSAYHRFRMEPEAELDRASAAGKLEDALRDAVHRHWRKMKRPAILLSGGYDSQYLFYTVAQSVEDTGRLVTVTWGENPAKGHADMDVARRTAARFGTRHIEIQKSHDRCIPEYKEMFEAQSGLTDSSFYHANELAVCRRLREEYGIESVMRGDECLGYGPAVLTLQNALRVNGMSLPEYVPGMARWLSSPEIVMGRFGQLIRDRMQGYETDSCNDLKDAIDFHERQVMNRNPLNYYKLHFLEVHCPLLDVEVLDVVRRLPENLRRHKRLFRHLAAQKAGGRLEIAESTNLIDWRRVLRESLEVSDFLLGEMEKLPTLFSRGFFENLAASLKSGSPAGSGGGLRRYLRPLKRVLPVASMRRLGEYRKRHVDQPLTIPDHFLVMRAAVLARWNEMFDLQRTYRPHGL